MKHCLVQMRDGPARRVRGPLVAPLWVRGLALGLFAAVILHLAARDLEAFPRAVVLLALFLLVLATAADVVWHVWTFRKPAPVAALSGSAETVAGYTARTRAWVSGVAVGLAAATAVLHGADAMAVLRAWVQLHRWTPPTIGLKVVPSVVTVQQPFHLTVTVDDGQAGQYRCEWRGLVAEWSTDSACDIERSAPLHFVDPDWPKRRIPISARVFDGDRLLGTTPDAGVTVSYAPVVELSVDKTHIIHGQKAEFTVRVDGHAPAPTDRCRWTVGGEFASSGRCLFSYSGSDLNSGQAPTVRVGVEVENPVNQAVGKAEITLFVDQPQRYVVYLVEASRRMAQPTPTGTVLDDVKTDLVDGLSSTDLGKQYVGVATFGDDASHALCYQRVHLPYPVQPFNLGEVKSALYLLQPGTPDAPLATALLRGLALLRPYTQPNAPHAAYALVSVAAGLDTCAGPKGDAALRALDAVMTGVRAMTEHLNGRLLVLTIGVGVSAEDRQQWDAVAIYAPTQSPYVIIPAPDIVTLGEAIKAAVRLNSLDYDTRLAACGELGRMLRTRSLNAGGAQVDRYCRTLSAP